MCIDPLDPECPKLAPNYFDACPALRKFFEWNKVRPESLQINLDEEHFEPEPEDPILDLTNFIGRKKRAADNSTTLIPSKATTKAHKLGTKGGADDYYDYPGDDVKTTTETPGESIKFNLFGD